MVRSLAAKHVEGKVALHHVEDALARSSGVDLSGTLQKLQGPIDASRKVYAAAHERIGNSPGYKELQNLPEIPCAELRQDSNEFATVYALAGRAQELLKKIYRLKSTNFVLPVVSTSDEITSQGA